METELDSLAVTMSEIATTEEAMHNALRTNCIASALRRRRVPAEAAAPTRGPLIVPLHSNAATFASSCILCSFTIFHLQLCFPLFCSVYIFLSQKQRKRCLLTLTLFNDCVCTVRREVGQCE